MPYFPLASGLLSGKYRAGEPPPEGTRLGRHGRPGGQPAADERLATVAALDELARGQGHSVLDLAFGWLLSRPAVASVIAGATRPEQIAANVAGGGWRLGPEVLAEVDAIAPAGDQALISLTGTPVAASPRRPYRGQADQEVVGDQRDGHVHGHQNGHGLGRLPLVPDVDVG